MAVFPPRANSGSHNTTLQKLNLGRIPSHLPALAFHSDGTEQPPITDLDLETTLFGTKPPSQVFGNKRCQPKCLFSQCGIGGRWVRAGVGSNAKHRCFSLICDDHGFSESAAFLPWRRAYQDQSVATNCSAVLPRPCLRCWQDWRKKYAFAFTLKLCTFFSPTFNRNDKMRWRLDTGNGAFGTPNRFLPLVHRKMSFRL
jgi:hypothetical protein